MVLVCLILACTILFLPYMLNILVRLLLVALLFCCCGIALLHLLRLLGFQAALPARVRHFLAWFDDRFHAGSDHDKDEAIDVSGYPHDTGMDDESTGEGA